MKTLLITLIIALTTISTPIKEVESTPTGTLITYTDGTGYYIGK